MGGGDVVVAVTKPCRASWIQCDAAGLRAVKASPSGGLRPALTALDARTRGNTCVEAPAIASRTEASRTRGNTRVQAPAIASRTGAREFPVCPPPRRERVDARETPAHDRDGERAECGAHR